MSGTNHKRIRVLYLTLRPDLARGGQVSLLTLLRKLDRTRYEPALVVSGKGALAREARKLDIPVHIHPNWPHLLHTPPWRTLDSMTRLRGLIHDFQPDLLHVDVPRLAHLAAPIKGSAKLVMHLRVITPDGLSDRILAAETDAMIAISRGVASRFARFPEYVRRKIHVVYNGIDTVRFHPVTPAEKRRLREKLDLPVGVPVVTFLSAFIASKRHDFILDFWRKVHENTGAVLVFAGKEPRAEKQRLQRRVAQEGFRDSVVFLPYSSHPEEIFASADLNLLPSCADEGFGRVIVEAGACEVPSVASDIPGVSEVIEHGRTGLLLPVHDRSAWEEAIGALVSDRRRLQRMGSEARELAIRRFSGEHYATEVMRVYETLVPSKRAVRPDYKETGRVQ